MSTPKKDLTSKEQHIKNVLKKIAERSPKNTPAIFKLPVKRNTPIAFSLSEIREIIKEKPKKGATPSPMPSRSSSQKSQEANALPSAPPRVLKAATLDDLLGGSVSTADKPQTLYIAHDEKDVPEKFLFYFRKLSAMRERLLISVGERSAQMLGTSAKETSGDLSGYGQHIADAGTDAADYDFGLNLVSNEQDLLREVELALNRIFNGTYGICEVTGKPISRDRLKAVPFTRFSKEGQDQYEKTARRTVAQRVGITASEDDDGPAFSDDEPEEV